MLRVCAWCGNRIRSVIGAEGEGDGAASHGICRACLRRLHGDEVRARAEAASKRADRDGTPPAAAAAEPPPRSSIRRAPDP